MSHEIKIENKPPYCSAWISKVSDKVLCNTIPCCGFCFNGVGKGEKYVDLNGKPLHEKIGKHPLVNGKFVFANSEQNVQEQ